MNVRANVVTDHPDGQYIIMAKYKHMPPEPVDTATDALEADYLVGEYRMAYGSDYRVWSRLRRSDDE